jgi:hypothetical protein
LGRNRCAGLSRRFKGFSIKPFLKRLALRRLITPLSGVFAQAFFEKVCGQAFFEKGRFRG